MRGIWVFFWGVVSIGYFALVIVFNLPNAIRSGFARKRGARVSEGDRVRAIVDVEARGLVFHRGPYTSGFRCRIPRGSVMVVNRVTWLGFSCALDGALEESLVPEAERADSKYAGAAFTFFLADIGRGFEVLEQGHE